MGEYEPRDSRNVTQKPGHEPGGIKRTGPMEDEERAKAKKREAEKDEDDGHGNADTARRSGR